MKADKLLLHIGQPKTGTTTLQNCFWRSQDLLLAKGISNPQVGPFKGNARLLGYHLLNDRRDDPLSRQTMGMDAQSAVALSGKRWEEICRDVAQGDLRKVVLSTEQFFEVHTAENIGQLNAETAKVAETREIIIYLRAPHRLLLSHLQQRLKREKSRLLDIGHPVTDVIAPLAQHWDGTIALRVFDRNVLEGGDIVTDFMTAFCPEMPADMMRRGPRDDNTSMSSEAIAVLLDVKAGKLDHPRDYQTLATEVRRADKLTPGGTQPRLRDDVTQAFIHHSAPDLLCLRDTYGLTFPDIDYDDMDPCKADKRLLAFDAAEQFCTVDAARKAEIFRIARQRTAMPAILRRWLARY